MLRSHIVYHLIVWPRTWGIHPVIFGRVWGIHPVLTRG